MTAVGLALLLAGVSAEPESMSIGGPRLVRGDELQYTGEILESGDRIGNRFRKRHTLEIRLFVLEANRESADCAVLTIVQPQVDPAVASAVEAIGASRVKEPPAPLVRLDLIRVDDRGRVRLLHPAAGPPPLPLASADTAVPPSPPLESPPVAEFGFFVPFPATAVKNHATWDSVEVGRPPIGWKAVQETVWNGGRCLELSATQQSTGFDQTDSVLTGWKRTDTVLVSPADGCACSVKRTIIRRDGRDTVGSVKVSYEQQPRNRALGVKYSATRREIETAWALGEEVKESIGGAKKLTSDDYRAKVTRIDQYLAENTVGTAFRPAMEASRRRLEAAAAGIAPPTPPVIAKVSKSGPPALGEILDDFVLPDVSLPSGQFRLSGSRGKPVLLIAYRPNIVTSRGTVKLASALQEKYGDKVRVVPLAMFETPDVASEERKQLKVDLPIYDGRDVTVPLGIDSWPVFMIADPSGKLRWRFDSGLGKETGYLIGKELDELLKPTGR